MTRVDADDRMSRILAKVTQAIGDRALTLRQCETMKRTTTLLYVLMSLHHTASEDALCVARLFSGDEFFNDEGPAACAAYDALCYDDGTNLAAAGDISGELSCSCELDQSLQCPACKCNPLHPVFNGSTCKSQSLEYGH